MPSHYCGRCLSPLPSDATRCTNLACGVQRPKAGWSRLLEAGDVIDRNYLVLEFIAIGGAGVTYRARALDQTGHPVPPDLAIKLLHSHRSSGALLRRLATEAQILQELNHPAIIECLGFVQRTGQAPYLVTRFEHGGTLEQWIAEVGPLPPRSAAGILHQILQALARAHKRGVVHRDLKPANVLLTEKTPRAVIPRVRVADFGIARVSQGLHAGLTRQGSFIGTPMYAAPEQFVGEAATAAADVFSAGALAVFLLSGRPYVALPAGGDIQEYYEAVLDALPARLPDWLTRSRPGNTLARLVPAMMHPQVAQRIDIPAALAWLDHALGTGPEPATLAPAAPPPAPVPPRPIPQAAAVVERPRRPSSEAPTLIREPARVPPRPRPPARQPSMQHVAPANSLPDPTHLGLEHMVGDGARRGTTQQAPPPRRSAPTAPVPFVRPENGPVRVRPSGQPAWQPQDGVPLPAPLPPALDDLLALLGAIAPAHRQALVTHITGRHAIALGRAISAIRTDSDPLVARGLLLLIELSSQGDDEAVARTLLTHSDPGVRVAASTTLGAVGAVAAVKTLSAMLRDPDPQVRAASARAMAHAARTHGLQHLATHLLRAHESDPAGVVQETVANALMDLE